MSLTEIYEWVDEEYGKPLVVYPQGYDNQHLEINEGEVECFWVVVENRGKRQIKWLIGGMKDISEGEGPSSLDCPLFFFELVPEETNSSWRSRVREFWRLQCQQL